MKYTVGDKTYYQCDECGFKCTDEDDEVGELSIIDCNLPVAFKSLVFCPTCINKYKLLRKVKGGFFDK